MIMQPNIKTRLSLPILVAAASFAFMFSGPGHVAGRYGDSHYENKCNHHCFRLRCEFHHEQYFYSGKQKEE